jgi:type IV pilus assembly protein PilB
LLTTLTNPQGLILLTGPTGSGKTSTLYAAIQQIKTPDRNIVTLEDPVEMQMPGITQVQMHERSGLTFARGLRSVLRQDPDVILVGEVRDRDTADLALEAALTGHLVLTTLHTNSAPAAITRLVDMGVAPFLVASSLSLVVAQRLARRVCPSCAAPYRPSDRVAGLLNIEINDIDGAMPMRGQGCSDCAQTGYLGRLGIFEVLPVTASLRAVLMATPNESAVTAAARAAGVQTLRAAALAKAHAGLTTYEEVLRVTQVDPGAVGQQCLTCSGTLAEDMVVCPWCATPVDRGHCLSCDRRMERSWRVCPWCRTPAPHPPVEQASATSGTPRVLVVDDSEAVRQFVTAVLHGTAEVVAVGSASEGLDLAASGGFDALVVDQVLPDLSGIEVIRLLRSEARTAALPVLMFTGGSNDGDLEQAARNAGADDYLEKPVDPAELESRIIQLVQRSAVFAD